MCGSVGKTPVTKFSLFTGKFILEKFDCKELAWGKGHDKHSKKKAGLYLTLGEGSILL